MNLLCRSRPLADRFGAAEDALGHADQPVGPVSHLLEPLQDLFDPVLQPVGWVPLLHPVRAGGTVVVLARRPWRPRGARRPGRPVVPVVMARLIVGEVVFGEVGGQFLGFVGGRIGLLGNLFGLLGLLLGSFGAAAGPPGCGAGLVGTPFGLGDGLIIASFLGQLVRFLGQVGGFLCLIGGLHGAFSAFAGHLGQVSRVLGELASLAGVLLGAGLGIAVTRVGVRTDTGHVVAEVVVAEVVGSFALVLHRVPGHAVRLAGLSHALANGDLPRLVRSHDGLFPGETARVCSPW